MSSVTGATTFALLLADCPTWRTLCSVDPQDTEQEQHDAALSYIVQWGEAEPSEFPRAYIVESSAGSTRHALGAFTARGSLSFRIFVARTPATAFETSFAAFTTSLATLRGELHTVNASGGYIDLAEIDIQFPNPEDAARAEKFWFADGTATYTLGAL